MSAAATIQSNAFVSGVATLAGGQGIAMALPILTAPILGRLFSPHDYGLLGAYMSIAVVAATIGNWQYAQAIVFEKRDERAWALVRVCVWTSLVTAALALAVPLAFAAMTLEAGGMAELRPWLWLVPVSAFISGMTGCYTALANRFTRYGDMAAIQAGTAVATAAVSIALGWYGWSAAGLLVSYLVGQVVTFAAYGALYRSLRAQAPDTSPLLSRAMGRRHRSYPMYSLPTSVLEQLAANAPVYALGLAGAPQLIGLMSRARTLLGAPLALIGNAMTQVFQQRAARDYARAGDCRRIFKSTFLTLGGLGIVPALVLAVAAPWLFETYLGPKWRDAGDIARILAPMLMLQLVVSPLSAVMQIAGRQKLDLALTIGYKLLVAAAVALPVALRLDPVAIIVGYSLAMSATYLLYLGVCWRLAKR